MKQDVIIIGGSFAGASAAMQLVRAQRKVTLVDAGQPRNRFAKHSHGFFGLDGYSPEAIKLKSWQQLLSYPTMTLLEDSVTEAIPQADCFKLTLSSGKVLIGKKLIIATGLTDILPDIEGIQARWGKTVAHCPYCHGYELRNRSLGVIATSEMSLHQASMIPDWGVTTYFSQGEFYADAEQKSFLQQRGVQFEDSPIIKILGEGVDISAVQLADGRTVDIQGLYVGPKTQMSSDIASRLGCKFIEAPMGAILQTDEFKQTSVAGVFAAGDIANPMQNATFASASGVMAGVGAHHQLIQELR
ncbi:NAD(P)/FAD-dependent oxidoreductase [Reinekea thalattae]|uniref:NAD(P)/FAD-dependent oxidoreductase n=1 Tax=Reinekea thalattae TaxID=2593301 RepID=A0A5C8ZAA0_9GAMM|nr:NAD(P)/FAD-dependent oxidoreductase [Reinekea thalattae]TXR54091.1 NAD(P)/FAD-dependent oxidoreductase [Reinekea thalattae]